MAIRAPCTTFPIELNHTRRTLRGPLTQPASLRVQQSQRLQARTFHNPTTIRITASKTAMIGCMVWCPRPMVPRGSVQARPASFITRPKRTSLFLEETTITVERMQCLLGREYLVHRLSRRTGRMDPCRIQTLMFANRLPATPTRHSSLPTIIDTITQATTTPVHLRGNQAVLGPKMSTGARAVSEVQTLEGVPKTIMGRGWGLEDSGL